MGILTEKYGTELVLKWEELDRFQMIIGLGLVYSPTPPNLSS